MAVAFAWSGVLVGPPGFGLLLDATGAYTVPWLVLAAISLAVAVTLPRPRPLVQRDERGFTGAAATPLPSEATE